MIWTLFKKVLSTEDLKLNYADITKKYFAFLRCSFKCHPIEQSSFGRQKAKQQ